MKTKLTAALAIGVLTLSACGGVDRDGTRDQFIEDIQTQLGATTDADCVDAVFDDYSDDEITALSENSDDARAQQLATELIECVDLGG